MCNFASAHSPVPSLLHFTGKTHVPQVVASDVIPVNFMDEQHTATCMYAIFTAAQP
jgi:hypothetical protein